MYWMYLFVDTTHTVKWHIMRFMSVSKLAELQLSNLCGHRYKYNCTSVSYSEQICEQPGENRQFSMLICKWAGFFNVVHKVLNNIAHMLTSCLLGKVSIVWAFKQFWLVGNKINLMQWHVHLLTMTGNFCSCNATKWRENDAHYVRNQCFILVFYHFHAALLDVCCFFKLLTWNEMKQHGGSLCCDNLW